jgi:hypothetical protein
MLRGLHDILIHFRFLNRNTCFVFQDSNPFLRGEKLPVAAKKGLDVVY